MEGEIFIVILQVSFEDFKYVFWALTIWFLLLLNRFMGLTPFPYCILDEMKFEPTTFRPWSLPPTPTTTTSTQTYFHSLSKDQGPILKKF